MTDDEWKEVEASLRCFCSVRLKCDGYTLTLVLSDTSNMCRRCITCYVNGFIKGEFLTEDCEERRRFMYPRSKLFFSAKERKDMKKVSKRMLKELNLDPEKKFYWWSPYWESFEALRRHLVKHNENIEIIREDEE